MEIQNHQATKLHNVESNSYKEYRKFYTATEIQAWLVSYLTELLEIEPSKVDVSIPFDRYGLDSTAVVGLTGDLCDWLEKELEPTTLYNYPTIEALSQHLAEEFSS